MVSTVTVCLTDNQRKALFSRARRHGTSLSAEVRKAIYLYLDFPPEIECESLASRGKEANALSIARLGDALASCHLPPL